MMPDATAAVDWLLQTAAGKGIEKRIYSRNETLHAPHLLDLRTTRYPHLVLLPRIWQLRHNLLPTMRLTLCLPKRYKLH